MIKGGWVETEEERDEKVKREREKGWKKKRKNEQGAHGALMASSHVFLDGNKQRPKRKVKENKGKRGRKIWIRKIYKIGCFSSFSILGSLIVSSFTLSLFFFNVLKLGLNFSRFSSI